MSKKKTGLVVKDNKLIEASYKLTLIEQRIILAAIVLARETQTGLGDGNITIEAKWFAKTFNMDEKSVYDQLREATKTLFDRFITIYDIEPESNQERKSTLRWISRASYVEGAGIIQFCFAQDLVPYITRLETNFTKYNLEKIAAMSSPYAIRLYELLVQWISTGQHEFEIAWLKGVLVLDDEYDRLFDFKKWVIDVAVKQINQHSDLTCSYTQRKTGRNVTHLTFNFDRKPEAKAATEPKTKPVIKRATKPTVQSAAPNPTGTSKEVKQALRELLAARKKITSPEIKTKPEPPPATSSPAKSIAQIMNELKIGDTPINPALAPGF